MICPVEEREKEGFEPSSACFGDASNEDIIVLSLEVVLASNSGFKDNVPEALVKVHGIGVEP